MNKRNPFTVLQSNFLVGGRARTPLRAGYVAAAVRKGLRALPSAVAAAGMFLLSPSLKADTHIWTGNAAGDNWSTPSNWLGLSVPGTNEAPPIILKFPAGFSGPVTNNIPGLIVDRLWMEGTNLTVHGAPGVSLTLRGLSDLNINLYSVGANQIAATLPLILEGTNRVASMDLLTIYSIISGTGGLNIQGDVRLDGTAANTYTGPTIVGAGVVTLDKYAGIIGSGAGVVSIPGPLIVTLAGTVFLSEDNGIADTSPVSIVNGELSLNGYDDTIGSLTIDDAEISTGGGMLTLGGNVLATGTSTILGNISLGGQTRIFDVGFQDVVNLWAHISNGGGGVTMAGLTKNGLGLLKLHSANYYSGGTVVLAGTLELLHAQALGSSLFGSTTIGNNGTLLLADGLVIANESLTINSGRLSCDGMAAWTGPITLTDGCEVKATGAGDELSLTGVISGTGNLAHTGSGRLLLGGTNSNTYTGTTTLEAGSLSLSKFDGALAVPGNLIIGAINNSGTNLVSVQAPEQIADAAIVTMYQSGRMTLNNGSDETIGDLVMTGAEINTGIGTLKLTGDVTANTSGQFSVISGKLSLGNAVRTFNVLTSSTWPALEISAVVSGSLGAGLVKQGGGELRLSANNSYPGITTINEGVLSLYEDGGLGQGVFSGIANGTVVASGASLSLNGVHVLAENLSLWGPGAGNMGSIINHWGFNSWSGPVHVSGHTTINIQQATGLTINGVISGASGLNKFGPGTLTYGGDNANTFSGLTWIKEGPLVLGKTYNVTSIAGPLAIGDGVGGVNADSVSYAGGSANQIADGFEVLVNNSGLLNLNGESETIGALTGTGNVQLADGHLTVGGNGASTLFGGSISGASGRLTKTGAGILTVTGNLTHTGDTWIKGGTLRVNGSILTSQTIATNEAVLGGNGQVNYVKAYRGVISPGSSVGTLNTGSLLLNNLGEVHVEIHGPNPGTDYDHINVNGTVTLGGARLTHNFTASTSTNATFTIIANDGGDPISGTFQGLPENGALWMNGRLFRISYIGGDGNDVVLTQLTTAVSPMITSVQKLVDGTIQIDGHGIAFTLYSIEVSEDLQNWESLTTVVSDDGGFVHHIDNVSNALPHCFYRLLHLADPGQF